jgi:hypothetical protein
MLSLDVTPDHSLTLLDHLIQISYEFTKFGILPFQALHFLIPRIRDVGIGAPVSCTLPIFPRCSRHLIASPPNKFNRVRIWMKLRFRDNRENSRSRFI